MFELRVAVSNLRRYKVKTVLNIMVCAVAILFVNVYLGHLENSREQFLSLPDKIPVEALVTTLDGSQASGMYIRESIYEGLRKSDYVKDEMFLLEICGRRNGEACEVMASNAWKQNDGCRISSDYARREGLSVGDTLSLMLESYEPESEDRLYFLLKPLGEVTLSVTEIDRTGEDAPDVLIALEKARHCYRKAGVEFHLSAASFYVNHALELDRCKEEMKELGLMEVTVQAMPKIDGNAILIKDQTFLQAAGSLERGYKIIYRFFPAVCVALAVAGFITSYLLMAGRRREYMLLRSLGMTRRSCMAAYSIEQGIGQLIGGCFSVFCVFFMLGTLTAIWVLGRTGLMCAVSRVD